MNPIEIEDDIRKLEWLLGTRRTEIIFPPRRDCVVAIRKNNPETIVESRVIGPDGRYRIMGNNPKEEIKEQKYF